MIRCYRSLTIILLLLFSAGLGYAQEHDPGVRDTLRLHSTPMLIGSPSPVLVSIYNDFTVDGLDFVLHIQSLDSGFARFDSARFLGRMADPTVLPLRIVNAQNIDGQNPDTLLVACLKNVFAGLPPGDDALVEMYFTPLAPGNILIDTATNFSGISLDFVAESGSEEYTPVFQPARIEILPGIEPPTVNLTETTPVAMVIGDEVFLSVVGTSPAGLPVMPGLVSLTDADNQSRLPLGEPEFRITDSTGRFSWRPAASDIGIWTASFSVTDSLGQQGSISAEIQVVSGSDYLVEFGSARSDGAPFVTGLVHGDYDGDQRPEVLMTGSAMWGSPSVALYDYFPGAGLNKLFEITRDEFARALAPLFLPGDDRLDALMVFSRSVASLEGSGQSSLELTTDLSPISGSVRNATVTDYDGDQHLDYALVNFENVIVYQGDDQGGFRQAAAWPVNDSGLTLNSADFDNDGWDDLAVGTVAGLEIYINEHDGSYRAGVSYKQRFGTTDLDITSRGTDFNADGIYDLCLATPSVGGVHSDVVVYFGRGDATFDQALVKTVLGQINASCPGDFNGDGHLDILYVNSAYRYLGLLFGDGNGNFVNELRYPVPEYAPRYLDCLDIDMDGDLDVVVSAYDLSIEVETALYLFTNQLDPIDVVSSDLQMELSGNADFELQAPNGGRLSRVSNSMASAELYRKNLDGDEALDFLLTFPSVQAGRHDLIVYPRPDRNVGERFSLEFKLRGEAYRIARNQPMSEGGFVFPLDPWGSRVVSPRQGKFIQTALPTFNWETSGVERFELATDLAFGNIIETATVSGGVYTLQMVLPYTDSATYYWRVGPEAGEAAYPIYAFNVVRVPTGVDDPGTLALLPDSCWLAPNYPNPFNPVTTVAYHLAEGGMVRITIHNVLGQLINTLVDGPMPSGTYTVEWDATDLNKQPVASGIYFYRMELGEFSSTRKMVLVR